MEQKVDIQIRRITANGMIAEKVFNASSRVIDWHQQGHPRVRKESPRKQVTTGI
jgi:hypothetical protein